MRTLDDEIFVCIDCETTGLDLSVDRVVEVAVIKFTTKEVLESYETLIDPERLIPESSTYFHRITDDMVVGKPKLHEVLEPILRIMGRHPVVGHGVKFDIECIAQEADKIKLNHTIRNNRIIDTLRLARHYGESPINSLEELRKHFNIPEEGAHRAMNDVVVNREVFKHLSKRFKSLQDLLRLVSQPVLMKVMPLGKHKGRPIKDLPLDYVKWAAHKDFDEDLIYSLRHEINRRKRGGLFTQASNPFGDL
jgi:DNA polymerase-3 subunit epsilon